MSLPGTPAYLARTRAALGWAVGVNRQGFGSAMDLVGLSRYDNKWTVAGFRPWAEAGSRVWIPQAGENIAASAGRFGSMAEFKTAVKEAWKHPGMLNGKRMSSFTAARRAGGLGGKALGLAGLVFTANNIISRVNSGEGIVKATGEEAASLLMTSLAWRAISNPWAAPLAVAAIGVSMYLNAKSKQKKYGESRRGNNFVGNSDPFMTQGAATMRQRSLDAIQRSFFSARRSLGQEAQARHLNGAY